MYKIRYILPRICHIISSILYQPVEISPQSLDLNYPCHVKFKHPSSWVKLIAWKTASLSAMPFWQTLLLLHCVRRFFPYFTQHLHDNAKAYLQIRNSQNFRIRARIKAIIVLKQKYKVFFRYSAQCR